LPSGDQSIWEIPALFKAKSRTNRTEGRPTAATGKQGSRRKNIAVIPAKAGIHVALLQEWRMREIKVDSRFRGNDGRSGRFEQLSNSIAVLAFIVTFVAS
jgi:hypothetical protein